MNRPRFRRTQGFTLVELITVIAIMAILLTLVALGIRGFSQSGRFDQSLNNIMGILERSRAYASAQDTYVWVAFYQYVPASGPEDVFVGSFASNGGTDPLNWTGSVTLPSPGTINGTTLTPIVHYYEFKGLRLQSTTLPNAPTSPSFPASAPNFISTLPSDVGPLTLSNTCPAYWVVQFTPNGMARNSANPISSIWLGLQPAYGPNNFDQHNIASIEINGLTGGSLLYRQ